jgi:hypothetical protein
MGRTPRDLRRSPADDGKDPPWMVLAFGAFFIGAGVMIGWSTWTTVGFYWDLNRRGVEAEAEILTFEEVSHRFGRSWRPVFRFSLPDGKVVRATSAVATETTGAHARGRRVPIVYDPLDPRRAVQAEALERGRTLGYGAMAVTVLFFLMAGGWAVRHALRAMRR